MGPAGSKRLSIPMGRVGSGRVGPGWSGQEVSNPTGRVESDPIRKKLQYPTHEKPSRFRGVGAGYGRGEGIRRLVKQGKIGAVKGASRA